MIRTARILALVVLTTLGLVAGQLSPAQAAPSPAFGTVLPTVSSPQSGESADRHTRMRAPRVTSLSPRRGTFAGGTRVTIRGKNLRRASQVLFGTAPAEIVSRRSTRLVVRSPAGVVGKVQVSVVTPGGTASRRTAIFDYVLPATRDTQRVTPQDGGFVADTVAWVTGGTDPDTGRLTPWQIGVPAGAPLPTLGQPFLLRPGAPQFPSGLAGRVSEIADQVDGTVRVTVDPVDLADAVNAVDIRYSGPVTADAPDTVAPSRAAADPQRVRAQDVSLGEAVKYSIQGPSGLSCLNPRGGTVSLTADLTTSLTDVHVDQRLKLGGFLSKPNYDATVTGVVRTVGKVSVSDTATCKPSTAWVNAHRRVIPLGTSGGTISFAPAMKLTMSGRGTFAIETRTAVTVSVSATPGKAPTIRQVARDLGTDSGGEVAVDVEAEAGIDVQLAVLDRAGLRSTLQLGVKANLTVTSAPQICVSGKIFFRFTLGLFLDAFVVRWDYSAVDRTIDLLELRERCRAPEGAAADDWPQITSERLPDATLGASYSARLSTEDNRAGTWSRNGGRLPAGLTISSDGRVTGVPRDVVQDYRVEVEFTDTSGRRAVGVARIRLVPGSSLGGGDLQVTLRWVGAADLDLHVEDPSGEEIYYRNPTAVSGGRLDRDANAGCNGPQDDDNAVENVFWPTGRAPSGTYRVWVKVYDTCSAALDWRLTVRRNGAVVLDQTGSGDSPVFEIAQGATARSTAVSRVGRAPDPSPQDVAAGKP